MLTLTQKTFMLKKAIGDMFGPVANKMVDTFMKIVANIRVGVEENAGIIQQYTSSVVESIGHWASILKKAFGFIPTVLQTIGTMFAGFLKIYSVLDKLSGGFIRFVTIVLINLKLISMLLIKLKIIGAESGLSFIEFFVKIQASSIATISTLVKTNFAFTSLGGKIVPASA